MQTAPKLWTRNFTIITLGTVVSMLGNSISGFAISLMVLDYTESTFLYVLTMVCYMLPRIIMPMVAGPYLDNFSRKKVIVVLDYTSAVMYVLSGVLLLTDWFVYPVFLCLAVLVGSIDSVYQVAYDSLYPTLVDKANLPKAYSISSVLHPLTALMVPVAAWIYERVGIAPLFLFNGFTFAVAATFEVFIKAPETQMHRQTERFSLKTYTEEFKTGIRYILSEKGLLAITIYFAVFAFATSSDSLMLPYCRETPALGVMAYTYIGGCGILGRVVGGLLHYRLRLKPSHKFAIAITVYIVATSLYGGLLFTPIWLMMVMMFLNGLLNITSFNIRISGTQSYVPNETRARFNGAFQMMTTLGGIAGQLLVGALGEITSARVVVPAFMALNLLAVFVVMLPNRAHVRKVYNIGETTPKPIAEGENA